MPTYEYVCGDCDHHFEQFQSITAEPIKSCPNCNGEVRRLIGAGMGLIFKGSGFYVTDYKGGGGNGKSSENGVKQETKKSEPKKDTAKGDD